MSILFSNYITPALLRSGHLQTLYPFLFRKIDEITYRREKLYLEEEDFLDLDWSEKGHSKLLILSHGLGGSSQSGYILGMIRHFHRAGWDALAWNGRGLGGESNQSLKMTHSGASQDLRAVIDHVLTTKAYEEIGLIGFSLGGNITLKYLGEMEKKIPGQIKRAVTFSVPCHLESSAWQLTRPTNILYMKSFLKRLYRYLKEKKEKLPNQINLDNYHLIKNFKQFDDRFVAPQHGFINAEDYWNQSSSIRYLNTISIPTLLVNAKDDPFLPNKCYPFEIADQHEFFHLEVPSFGGHVGFMQDLRHKQYWSEERALKFMIDPLPAPLS
ncbi:MAG: alpha/beta fold hydrolase [Deltaproteobacteria bacterium]|nr:alpha/beta fold hydrolase [Deltaproteobacteria bacterium]